MPANISNLDVELMVKFNEACRAYNLKPYDFHATYQDRQKSEFAGSKHHTPQIFTIVSDADQNPDSDRNRFLKAIGAKTDDVKGEYYHLEGSYQKIIEALVTAIDKSPSRRIG